MSDEFSVGSDRTVPENEWPFIDEISAFERADKRHFPAPGQIVFVGSSTFTLWDSMADDLAPFPVVRRGFGGSQIDDSLRYVERIVLPYQPRLVVVYAGDNDLANGRTPQAIFDDYKAMVRKIHAALPLCEIAYLSIKPSIARWALIGEIRHTNALIEKFSAEDGRLSFIDAFAASLGDDGLPLPDIFVEDELHLNRKGYDIWSAVIKGHLSGCYEM